MFIILKTYTESLSYISTSFSPLGPGPCLLVAYRVRVSLDNRNERKWTTKQSSIIRIRDKKWNGDALEKCFFLSLFGFGWPSKQFRKEQRCASTRWDVILMMYCWLSIDKFTFIIYPCTVYHWFFILSLCCVSNLENALRSFSSIFCFDFFSFAGSSCGRFIQLIVRFGVDFRSFFNSNVFQCIYGHYSLYNDFITSLCFLSFSLSLALAFAWSLTVISSSLHSFIQPFISIV